MKELQKLMLAAGGILILYSWIGAQTFQADAYITPTTDPLFLLGAALVAGSLFVPTRKK